MSLKQKDLCKLIYLTLAPLLLYYVFYLIKLEFDQASLTYKFNHLTFVCLRVLIGIIIGSIGICKTKENYKKTEMICLSIWTIGPIVIYVLSYIGLTNVYFRILSYINEYTFPFILVGIYGSKLVYAFFNKRVKPNENEFKEKNIINR